MVPGKAWLRGLLHFHMHGGGFPRRASQGVSEGYRGRGYGAQMLGLLEQDAGIQARTASLYAIVKCNNAASQKCFEKLKYSKECHDGYFLYRKALH